MSFVCAISIILVSTLIMSVDMQKIQRVKVDVYYEALCPLARKFIVQQLYPALLQRNVANRVNLTLIPYGKAETFSAYDNITGNNVIEFECHHGQFECYGNKIQACALQLNTNDDDKKGLGYSTTTLGFINCLMSTDNVQNRSLPNTRPCAKFNNISKIEDIEDCANNESGSLYLAKLGNQTRNFQNPLSNVPSVVFSEEYKKEESDLAEKDFIKALCAKIQGEKPAECYKNLAEKFSVNVGLLLITMFTCYFY